MSNFKANYNLILKELKKITQQENFYFKPVTPKMSDLEIISLVIYAEYKSIDSEHQLFRELQHTFLHGKIERTVYNRRKRKLQSSQKQYFYGYKLHTVCSLSGVFQNFDLSVASIHDVHYLKDIKTQLSVCVLLADKGYLCSQMQTDLFNTTQIKLQTPKRKNQENYQ